MKSIITFKIYNELFKKINDQYIDIFLCGGVSKKNKKSIRDSLREILDDTKNIRTLYPEDIFIEILTLDKNSDLLSLEKVLADNCDLICIVAESAGSLVELGAFVNNKNTKKKVIALIDKDRKKDRSFIMLGPVKYLEKSNNNHVIFYNSDIETIGDNLKDTFKKYRKGQLESRKNTEKDINTIVGMYNYIPLLIYFYNDPLVSDLRSFIKEIYIKEGYDEKQFYTLFNSGRKLLYKEKYIYAIKDSDDTQYKLTKKGYKFVDKLFLGIKIKNRRKLYDSIRFDIMEEKYYQKSCSS